LNSQKLLRRRLEMKNQAGSSRLDTVLKMLLIAFISLLAFSSGVFFGKRMSDSDYQLKALEGDFGKEEKSTKLASGEKFHSAHDDEEDAIAAEEVAALTDKYVNDEKQATGATAKHGEGESAEVATTDHAAANEHAPAGHASAPEHAAAAAHEVNATHEATTTHQASGAHEAKPVAHESAEHAAPAAAHSSVRASSEHTPAPTSAAMSHAPASVAHTAPATAHTAASAIAATNKPDMSAAHVAAARVAANHAPSEPVKHEVEVPRTPSSLPKTVGAAGDIEYTVQIASYPTADAAKEHAAELVKRGISAFPVEAIVDGRTWYRVSVGSFKTMKEATIYRAQLKKQADVQTALIQRIQR
jgi:cell division protein FtsN